MLTAAAAFIIQNCKTWKQSGICYILEEGDGSIYGDGATTRTETTDAVLMRFHNTVNITIC